ncbi:LysR substrate-binding domain-containing protein [Jhaorihella thermophila]
MGFWGAGFRCNALDALRAACLAGEGIACLPLFLCDDDIRAERLKILMEDRMDPDAEGGIMLLRPETTTIPRRVRALIDFLACELKSAATDI